MKKFFLKIYFDFDALNRENTYSQEPLKYYSQDAFQTIWNMASPYLEKMMGDGLLSMLLWEKHLPKTWVVSLHEKSWWD